ncbi:hypothetical protein EDC96DRAFT_57935 [Choanephora cucurbitarum]|nr:hypothetical protein EDC96DRAFT_57935 [Choanephora cucurbitarum]
MIHLLPTEIISYISTYLEQKDHFQLVTVNHVLYNVFIKSLYRTIELHSSYEFESFLNGSRPFQLVKYFTYTISGHEENISKFSTRLPFLTSLTLRVNFMIPLTRFSTFRYLRQLTLVTRDCDEDLLPVILTATPYLIRLEICFLYKSLSIRSLDVINRLCPVLEHIHLTSNSLQPPAKSELDSNYRLYKLKSFKIIVNHSFTQHPLWLQCIGKRYPNIESLSFESGDPILHTDNQYPAEFYQQFFSNCPYLNDISWANMLPDDMFLANLSSQQKQLQKLYLCATDSVMDSFIETTLSQYTHFSSIMNLDIQLAIPCDRLVQFLGKACPQLQQLKVDNFLDYNVNHLSMNDVFDLLPSLNLLNISNCQLYNDNHQQPKKKPHPLKKLTIGLVTLSGSVFDCVALRCPDIHQITLREVLFEDGSSMKIHLPNQKLTKIEISSIQLKQGNIFKQNWLIHLRQKEKSDWYSIRNEFADTLATSSSKQLDKDEKKAYGVPPQIDDIPYVLWNFVKYNHSKGDEVEYLDIECQSLQSLYINNKRIH